METTIVVSTGACMYICRRQIEKHIDKPTEYKSRYMDQSTKSPYALDLGSLAI